MSRHFRTLTFWRSSPTGSDDVKPRENWTRKRIIRWSLGLIAALVLIVLATPVAGITPDRCARIRPGMTQDQVEAILGAPPGWYDGITGLRYLGSSSDSKGPMGMEWAGDRGSIEVIFDGSGRVFLASFYRGEATGHDWKWLIAERITRRNRVGLERLWQKW